MLACWRKIYVLGESKNNIHVHILKLRSRCLMGNSNDSNRVDSELFWYIMFTDRNERYLYAVFPSSTIPTEKNSFYNF